VHERNIISRRPFVKTLFHHLVASQAEHAPDRTALLYKDGEVTYSELMSDVECLAGGLVGLGIRPRDRVAVYLEKRIETVTSLFAISAAGGAFVPVNPLLRDHQVGYILRDCNVKVLVTSPERLTQISSAIQECPDLEAIILVGERDPAVAPSGAQVLRWTDVLDSDRATTQSIDADMAAILYTSGSTGQPKGVMLSHRNLMAGAESVSHYIGNVADDRILAVLPLSFDAGLSQVTTGFNVGATVALVNFLFASDVVRECAKHEITGLTCVPPLWIKLAAEDWPSEVGERLRYFATTGGHMPGPLLEKLRSTFPRARPFLMYGLTEAFRSTFLEPEQVDRRPGSIGKAIPNAEILVVNEHGVECVPGETGELVHRGALVSLGYWNSPDLTARRFKPAPAQPTGSVLPEIAVWSGDLVRKDEDGYIYFVGRNDEMIKTSGYRVSPTEVEEVIFRTGLVSEIAAIGLPDDELGQAIVVVAAPPEAQALDVDAVRDACRKLLPRYMVPSQILERSDLPRNPNGKIDRTSIRRELIEEMGRDDA
jgi:acyl-CoA ligase (AMP-forming) (exosortase A-associated)